MEESKSNLPTYLCIFILLIVVGLLIKYRREIY